MSNNPPVETIPLDSKASRSPMTAISFGDPTVLQVVNVVINSATNSHTRRAYSTALFGFLRWYESEGKPGFGVATINAYKAYLVAINLSPSTINLKLSAIRKLSHELGEQGLLDPLNAAKIAQIKGFTPLNSRMASFLSREQAQCLINSPDTLTLRGQRDRAILALMVGCGLNRSEISYLCYENIQQLQGRWAIVDLVGKGNRSRTVPMPPWAKVALDGWTNALEDCAIPPIPTQRIFRAINKADKLAGERQATEKRKSDGFMSPQAIADVLITYTSELGYKNITTQAIRRTFAKLARKGGAEIDQIQLSLGHSNHKTTERFLGT
ncbi:MAG: tyrosine-type recombinase/integrase, partial [Anaerolineaceae bacterium]|nr:tyrosine-type recombinase/integrase [Anaerolineaceae bacterium]